MNTKLKKLLYESIMKSVAKTVKKSLNESFDANEDKIQLDIDKLCELMYGLTFEYYGLKWTAMIEDWYYDDDEDEVKLTIDYNIKDYVNISDEDKEFIEDNIIGCYDGVYESSDEATLSMFLDANNEIILNTERIKEELRDFLSYSSGS